MNSEPNVTDPKMNPANLYCEETFTDRSVGTIRRLKPVKKDGSADDGRKVIYVGHAQIMTAMGAVPLSFEIEAASLEEAIERFANAAQQAIGQTLEEIKEMHREAASSIVIPETGVGAGMPGGGKIQMP